YPDASTQLVGPWQERAQSLNTVFVRLVQPAGAIFQFHSSFRHFLYYLIGAAWTIVVWSFIGLAVTRVAALRLTRDERIGIDDA
ncbi:MAG: hypothetical protein GTO41_23850, partial [Burkholderiales bacterium]|nr:hypothetical protein [Burkholderiales bacterium]